MNHEEIKKEYIDYLMDRIGLEKDGDDGYYDFCRKMLDSDFVPLVDMDSNRCCECLGLRADFEEAGHEYGADMLDFLLADNGTMMELLCVMAEKMQYEMADSQYEASVRKWFVELLGNCGLDRFARNEDFKKEGAGQEIDDILYTVIFRDYGWDGEGGLFPLFLAQRDQRRLELVAQMNDYLAENYDI